MRWTDVREIAIALAEAHPDVAPLSIRFTDLHRWVRELPASRMIREVEREGPRAIQMAWVDEVED
jgi:FeS assembly protein IscX